MKKTKILAFILSLVTVASTVAITPPTVYATEGTDSNASFQSTRIEPPLLVSVDGYAKDGEIWGSITDVLNFTMFQTSHNGTTSEKQDFSVGTVKIANDGEYVYLYVEALKARNEFELMIEYDGVLICKMTRAAEHQIWINNGSASTDNTWGVYHDETRTDTAANAIDATDIEISFKMPEALKAAVAEGDVEIEVSMYIQTGDYDLGTNWEDGFALEGTIHNGNAATVENGQTVILKHVEKYEAPVYSSALAQTPITIDGKITEGDIWSSIDEANILKLDAWKSGAASAYSFATAENLPTVKIANDSEYLYIYLEADKFTTSTNEGGRRVWITVDFNYSDGTDDFEYFQWFTNKERTANDGKDATYCIEFNEETPSSGGAIEAKFTIPEEVKSELSSKDVEIKLSVYLQNAMQADMTTETNWQAGFTSSTGEFKVLQNTIIGDRVLLKQAQP